jgi:hypothetical protein
MTSSAPFAPIVACGDGLMAEMMGATVRSVPASHASMVSQVLQSNEDNFYPSVPLKHQHT